MCDVLCLGELLIDFTPSNLSTKDRCLFERNPGGAPANVAVQLSRLGTSSGFIGKVGNDGFGTFLKSTLDQNNVSTEGLVLDNNVLTTLAFVHLDELGDRSFSFYRNPGSDTQLELNEVRFDLVEKCKVLHFGSLSFTDEPSKSTTLEVLDYAKRQGKVISYDPNWRQHLWSSEDEGIAGMKLGLKYCDIIKVSEEELELVTHCSSIESGIKTLIDGGIRIVLVTQGPEGCYVGIDKAIRHVRPYSVQAIDTTGSGDSYLGAFLHKFLMSNKGLKDVRVDDVVEWADYANASGALCASRSGSIPSLPTPDEIRDYIDMAVDATGRSISG